MDLRPQAHDIIRTWLFSTVVRAHFEHGTLPWTHAAISGLDPRPRPQEDVEVEGQRRHARCDLLEQYGADAVRYWAASGRPGTDTAFDEGQMKVGRRLAIKMLNAVEVRPRPRRRRRRRRRRSPSRSTGPCSPSSAGVVDEATAAFEGYDYARALERTEAFFWTFCDDYLELVKDRAYGAPRRRPGARRRRRALQLALSTLLRLFAPFLPFVTEEVWSWWQAGSVHRAPWPTAAELAGGRCPAGRWPPWVTSLSLVRKAKSEAKVSMRADVSRAVVTASPRSSRR